MSPDDRLASFTDLVPEGDDFLRDVTDGLSRTPKTLPCKYFYDETGSKLFDQICDLPEYYPTRTELALLEASAPAIARHIGPGAQIVEYGCGSINKIHALLDALEDPAAYVAVDISREHLLQAAETLANAYPALEIHVVSADFTRPFDVPRPQSKPDARKVGFFPGSTIGNFGRAAARGFLESAARVLGPGGGMVIGVDLKKDPAILHAAYNDAAGVTAAFNLNLLARINRELDADFDLEGFEHRAHYDPEQGRVEMHLVSRRDQTVSLEGRRFLFAAKETIHTENSNKYAIDEFQAMARKAGYRPTDVWTDKDELFSIHYLEVA